MNVDRPAANQGRAAAMTLTAALLGWMFDGMEMGIFPLVAGPGLREMGATAGMASGSPALQSFVNHWMGVVTASFLVGAAMGGLVFGWLGDRVGRVRAMTWSILFYSVFTGLCYFAASPTQLAGLRFLAALGMGGEWALGVALVMECWPEGKRPLLAGLIGAAANVGYVLIALLALWSPIRDDSWRWVMLVGAAPALLTFAIRLFVPESHRWEETQKQAVKASPLREIFQPGSRKTTLLAILFASIALIVTWGIVQWIPLWADQIVGDKDPRRKAMLQLCSATGAIIGSLLAPLLGDRLGRRWTYFGMCAAAIVTCQWLFLGFQSFDSAFLAVTVLVGITTASFYGWLPLYLPELFPTRVRATGQGLAFNFGRIFAAVGALLMPSLMAFFGNSYPRAGATLSLIYLVGMVAIWWAPETRGKPLPD
jgi:SHS family sialic acid transporter-like MFS transporter